MLKEAIHKLTARQALTRQEMLECVDALLRPDAPAALAAAWLVALKMKGETAEEIAAAAEALRARADRVLISDAEAIDTCGTGGDGASTFNISTTAAFVVAGAGVTVAKHGNRAVSSTSGSADVLHALGLDLEAATDRIRTAIDQERIGFLFAQKHHPAMRHIGPVRGALGMRTIFNLAGPLSNPAFVKRQVLGVYNADLVNSMATSLAMLGTRRAWVVHGDNALDEISLSGETVIAEVREGGAIRTLRVTAEQAGLSRSDTAALRGGTAAENATTLRSILQGEKGPRRDAVLLNAAAGLVVGERASDLREGVVLAAQAIDSGSALGRLEGLLAHTGRREAPPSEAAK
jgi:anthranilate phosphoribosyltransferase